MNHPVHRHRHVLPFRRRGEVDEPAEGTYRPEEGEQEIEGEYGWA